MPPEIGDGIAMLLSANGTLIYLSGKATATGH
jgi:hypothetical protein